MLLKEINCSTPTVLEVEFDYGIEIEIFYNQKRHPSEKRKSNENEECEAVMGLTVSGKCYLGDYCEGDEKRSERLRDS